MIKNSKFIYGIIIFIISAFIIWNIVWIINYNEYSKLCVGYKKYNKTMGKQIENYNCTLKCPDYLSFQGNFAISKDNISIIIWPDLFINETYTFGLRIFDEQLNHGYMFYVDNQLNYLDIPENKFTKKETEIINKILNKNINELKEMKSLAKEEWGCN